MNFKSLVRPVTTLLLTTAVGAWSASASAAPPVVVNGKPLSAETISALEGAYRTQVIPGRYWYDPVSGAWGMECQGTQGFLMPALQLGGPLQADASCGNTGIFFNGRELHSSERQYLLQILGAAYPGRYRFDAYGNVSQEGGGPVLVNLLQVVQQQSRGVGGGDGVHYYRDSNGSGMFSEGCSSVTVNQPGGGYTSATIGCD